MITLEDRRHLAQALALARRGLGRTSPNPCVGAVLVSGGEVVGAAYHERAGSPHAETLALKAAGGRASGATLYVNIEPCCHHGRTPPCTHSVLAAGVRRVVACHKDPNPMVNGHGFAELEKGGLEVEWGALREAACRLNEPFLRSMESGRPLGIMKAAQTLDGRIAAASGASKWITSEVARAFGRALRATFDAVAVGVETVLRDDPDLRAEAAAPGDRRTLRVVFDSRLRTPATSRLLSTAPEFPVLLVATDAAAADAEERLLHAGAQVVRVPAGPGGSVDLAAAAAALHAREIQSVLYEGGGRLHDALLTAGLVDRALIFIAPKLLGGRDGTPAVDRATPLRLEDALPMPPRRVRRVGEDLLYEVELHPLPGLGG